MAGPGGGLRRSWRRWRRRGVAVPGAVVVVAIAVVVGIVVAVTGTSRPAAPTASAGTSTTVRPPDQASTSSRGVTAHSIRVVFPVSNLTALSEQPRFRG